MPFPEIDWSGTPLGPRKDWPPSLAAVYRLMMHSRQPMFLAWGAELTLLYNLPYAAILGPRHPNAFAQPFERVWVRDLAGHQAAGGPRFGRRSHLAGEHAPGADPPRLPGR